MDSVNSIGRMPDNCQAGRACAKPAAEEPPKSASTAESTAVDLSRSQSADITLVTAEGDKVTLSTSQTMEMSFEAYNSKGQSTGSAAGASAEVRKSSEFTMTVDGDLNKAELKDIRKAIRTIFKAERDVLNGHDERAAERTAKLAGLDQIASIDATTDFQQTVSVTQATVATAATKISAVTNDPAAPPQSAPVPAAPAPSPFNDPAVQAETQQLPQTTPAAAADPSTPAPSAVQHFTVATFDQQQHFTFQYLWDAGRPVAVQGPGVPALNGSQAAA